MKKLTLGCCVGIILLAAFAALPTALGRKQGAERLRGCLGEGGAGRGEQCGVVQALRSRKEGRAFENVSEQQVRMVISIKIAVVVDELGRVYRRQQGCAKGQTDHLG